MKTSELDSSAEGSALHPMVRPFVVIDSYQCGDIAFGVWVEEHHRYQLGDGDCYNAEELARSWKGDYTLLSWTELEARLNRRARCAKTQAALDTLWRVSALLEPLDLCQSRFRPEWKSNVSKARVLLDRVKEGTPPVSNDSVAEGCKQFQYQCRVGQERLPIFAAFIVRAVDGYWGVKILDAEYRLVYEASGFGDAHGAASVAGEKLEQLEAGCLVL